MGAYLATHAPAPAGNPAADTAAQPSQAPVLADWMARAGAVLRNDARVQAIWLEGSLASGQADAWSDADLHVAVADADYGAFYADRTNLLNQISPTAFLRDDPRQFVIGMTTQGVHFDLSIEKLSDLGNAARPALKMLYDRTGNLATHLQMTARAAGQLDSARLNAVLGEFWRCMSLLPVVIGRGELIVAVQGLAITRQQLIDLMVLESAGAQQGGVKRLNPLLNDEQRDEIAASVPLPGLDAGAIVARHADLVRSFMQRAPTLAARAGVAYPSGFEQATLALLTRELVDWPANLRRS